MNYQDTIDKALVYYPMLYLRYENLVVHHIFFGAGSGYKWINGELVDSIEPSTHRHTEAEIDELVIANEARKIFIDKIRLKASADGDDIVNKLLLKVNKGLYKKEPTKIRWICEYSNIVNIPWDITQDWFDASVKALRWASTLECTDEDKRYLVLADLRLCAIENRMDDGTIERLKLSIL